MNLISVIIDDIKHKRNLDIYLTVAVCVPVISLNMMGLTDQSIVSSAILTVLMTLSISLLMNRRSREKRKRLYRKIKDLSNRMYKLGLSDIEPVTSFSEGFDKIIEEDKNYGNIRVFAHIGDRYHSSIYDSSANIENLNIMLRNMDNLSSLQFPT